MHIEDTKGVVCVHTVCVFVKGWRVFVEKTSPALRLKENKTKEEAVFGSSVRVVSWLRERLVS